jgi:hypothetical protein
MNNIAILFSGSSAHCSVKMSEKELDRMEKYFLAKAKQGIVLSPTRLLEYCKKNKIECELYKIRQLRRRWKWLAIFSKSQKPPAYMGMTIQRYGVLMVDLAEFGKRRKSKQRGRKPWEEEDRNRGKRGRRRNYEGRKH